MLAIAYYFLQVVLCSGIMYGYYWLVLRNKRFHQYNRFYLIAITLLAWIVPLIKIRWSQPVIAGDADMMQLLAVVADSNSAVEDTISRNGFAFSSGWLAGALYVAVALVMLLMMVRALIRLYVLLKRHSRSHVGDVYLVLTQVKGTPFSFFRYIFWNEEIDIRSEAGQQILQHELTHVKEKHSIDKIFFQLVLAAGWFNPFFWLIRREMEMIHEFIADKRAVADGDTAALAGMLLAAAYPKQQFHLANPFFFSPIRRRLQMLTNTGNPRFSYIRRLVILPLLGILVVLFAFRNKERYETISVASVMEQVINTVKPGEPLATDSVTSIPAAVVAAPATQTPQRIVIRLSEQQQKSGGNLVDIIPDTTAIRNRLADALIVYDGKKISHEEMSAIPMSEIDMVSIMKDQAAVALYGEEAANGVVVIRSKKMASTDIIGITNISADPAATRGVLMARSMPGIVDSSRQFHGVLSTRTLPGIHVDSGRTILSAKNVVPDGQKPDIYVNGEPYHGEIGQLEAGSIQRVNVYSASDAAGRYGDGHRGGIVDIITTKASQSQRAGADDKSGSQTVTVGGRVVRNGMSLSAANTLSQVVVTGYPSLASGNAIPPSFPGGTDALQKFLERTLDKNIGIKNNAPAGKYTVSVMFTVMRDGTIKDVRTEDDPGYGMGAEAVRAITAGPNWVPGKRNGTDAHMSFRMPVSFVVNR